MTDPAPIPLVLMLLPLLTDGLRDVLLMMRGADARATADGPLLMLVLTLMV